MADGLTIDVDTLPLETALNQLGAVAQPYINDASRISAQNIVREAKARLHRQLGPNATGATEAGIEARVAFDGNGYVVLSEREPFPNLPLWIEKGTKQGKPGSHTADPRRFFYVSAQLEVGPHEDRLRGALTHAMADQWLGE